MTTTLSSRARERISITAALMLLSAALTHPARAAILNAKRGFGSTSANYAQLQASGAGWYYTWGTNPGTPGNYNADFYPMFWNEPDQSAISSVVAMNPKYVLGFNEPDNPDQADMTVSQAISSWKQISAAFTGTSTQLVSPAVEDTPAGQQWLEQFMAQAEADKLKVDAVAFHWYDTSTPTDPQASAAEMIDSVEWYHNTFKLPVFITEFAINDWNGGYTAAQMQTGNEQFLSDVLPQLNSLSCVAGYSFYNWFPDTPLISGTPPEPTPMGYNYVGAVTSGNTVNIGGAHLGEHVAYLDGGTLTANSAPGSIKYISVLVGTSTITGTVDWQMTASADDWVRVQSGADLVKSGADTITFGSGAIVNDGTVQIDAGALLLAAPMTGSGSVVVNGGTLIAENSLANDVTVKSGAVMSGGGTVQSVVNVYGTVKAGSGQLAQTMNISTLKLADNSRVILILNKPDSSPGSSGNSLIIAGNLMLGSGVTFDVMHGYDFGPGVYRLISITGALSGLDNLSSWHISGPANFTYALIGETDAINLSVVSTPEPTPCAILSLGLLLAGVACLKRRRPVSPMK